MTRRGGSETTFGFGSRWAITAATIGLTALSWLVLAPTLIAVPVILIPGTVFAALMLRDLWRPVPTAQTGVTTSRAMNMSQIRSARAPDHELLTSAGRWAALFGAIAYLTAVLVYVTGDDGRKFVVLGSIAITGGVLALRWGFRR